MKLSLFASASALAVLFWLSIMAEPSTVGAVICPPGQNAQYAITPAGVPYLGCMEYEGVHVVEGPSNRTPQYVLRGGVPSPYLRMNFRMSGPVRFRG